MAESDLRPYNNSELFSERYLDTQLKHRPEWDCTSEAEATLSRLVELYNQEYNSVTGYTNNEEDTLDKWIEAVLEILGYEYLGETGFTGASGSVDRILFETHEKRVAAEDPRNESDYSNVYKNVATILEAKPWDADFSERFSEERNYFNASQQIKYYLSNLPQNTVRWGILTNGRHWRLYGTYDHQTFIFYEVDLPSLIENNSVEDFKYFYCLFRPEAFARQTRQADCFLDQVYKASETTARELGDDLQDNVFEALAILGEGFIETNDLEVESNGNITGSSLNIDGRTSDRFTLEDLKEQSLVYLYRLMFVFYAESRGLLQPDESGDRQTYDTELSLITLRDELTEINDSPETAAKTYLKASTTQWDRLDTFFKIIDTGLEDINLQAYNGGLFDREEHTFLNHHRVSNHHLSQVIFLLSTTQLNGTYEPVDYKDLRTRHLGAVYEGLLEHQFMIAETDMVAIIDDDDDEVWEEADEVDEDATIVDSVSAGDLYVSTDDYERKVSGSYYTPKYIVDYILQSSLTPRIDELHSDLENEGLEYGSSVYAREFRDRVLDLNILDPAMGSGHFLTQATSYLAREIIEVVREADELIAVEIQDAELQGQESAATDGGETGSKFEEKQIRRDIAKECIYGVDQNAVAVELAKLSMWLETLAEDQPLAFLDHHFKHGDSLIGSDIEDINGLNAGESSDEQATISRFTERRKDVIKTLMEVFEDLLSVPNETLEDAREMKRIYYNQIQSDSIYQRFKQIANVHTSDRFGLDWNQESAFDRGDLPSDAFQYMAEVLEEDEIWKGDPEDGSAVVDTSWFNTAQQQASELSFFHWKLEFPEVFYDEEANKRPDAGFDAVLGNPPWLGTRTGEIDSDVSDYLKKEFDAGSGQSDLAAVFLEQAVELSRSSGSVGFVVPKRLATNESFEDIRDLIVFDRTLNYAVDLGVAFEGVNNDVLALVVDSDPDAESVLVGDRQGETDIVTRPIDHDLLNDMPFTILPVNSTQEDIELVKKINKQSTGPLGPDVDVARGAEFGMTDSSIHDEPSDTTWPILDHRDVERHLVSHSGQHIDLTEADPDDLKEISIYSTVPKLLIRFLSSEIIAGRDKFGYVSTNLVYHVQCDEYTDYLCGLLSSNLITFWYLHAFQSNEVKFPHVQKSHIKALPVVLPSSNGLLETVNGDPVVGSGLDRVNADIDTDNAREIVEELVDEVIDIKKRRHGLNLNIMDYLGEYSDEEKLADIGIYQPLVDSDSILSVTSQDEYENPKIGSVDVDRDGNTLWFKASVRYKTDDPDKDTNQHGYTETGFFEAFKLLEVPEMKADLIERFVPAAVDEELGGFRENATMTISLIDRLESIKIPDLDAVEDRFRRYNQVADYASDLDDDIGEIEDVIDDIVFECYELNSEEVELIGETVKDDD